MSRRIGILAALVLLLAGCAGSGAASASPERVPRARCLGDSSRQSASDPTRPLFFLFCVESP